MHLYNFLSMKTIQNLRIVFLILYTVSCSQHGSHRLDMLEGNQATPSTSQETQAIVSLDDLYPGLPQASPLWDNFLESMGYTLRKAALKYLYAPLTSNLIIRLLMPDFRAAMIRYS